MAYPKFDGDYQIKLPASDGAIQQILVTIRTIESGGNYQSGNGSGSSASGAYQFIDSSWRNLASQVPSATAYASKPAKFAPPAVQDAVAAVYARQSLEKHDGWVSSVPLSWYVPAAISNQSLLDKVPAGNVLTPRQYVNKWLGVWASNGGSYSGPPLTAGVHTGTVESGLDTLGGIGSAVTDAITSPFSSVVDFLKLLWSTELWIRIAKVVAGIVLAVGGLAIFAAAVPVQIDIK